MEYLDFDLEIKPGDGPVGGREYPVAVLESPSGEASRIMVWPYDEIKLRMQLMELENVLLRSAATHRSIQSEEERTVEEFGSTLFKAVFSDEVRNRYEVSLAQAQMQGKGLRIKLRIQAPELAALPWEFLFDPNRGEYISFSRQTPVVRYPSLPITIKPLKVTPPLRILGMVASPRGLATLDVRTEKERLSQPLKALQAAGLVELHWLEGQTWRDLQSAMRRGPWHVFHFIGHGGFDTQREEGFLALCDEKGERADLSAKQLARLIADHNALRLVVLNACEGGRSSQDDVFSSSASILLRGGVPAVLAMQYAITDRAAVEFARTFYESIADGVPVDTAVAEGRLAISMAFADTVEWGTPVLYLRAENGELFHVDRTKLAPAPAAQPSGKLNLESLKEFLGSVNRLWWIGGAIGLVLLCLTIALGTGLPKAATAMLNPQPSHTLTHTSEAEASPTPSSLPASPTLEPESVVAVVPPDDTPTPSDTPIPLFNPTSTFTQEVSAAATTPEVTSSTELAAGATRKSSRDGMVEIYIPPGDFQMGCSSDPDFQNFYGCLPNEGYRPVNLGAYWIDQTQVTNAQYKKCVEEGGCKLPREARTKTRSDYYENPEFDNYPVVAVTWDQAKAYCEWYGRRLPTEAEWEKAARGNGDPIIYPWGNDLPTCDEANFFSDPACSEARDTSAVNDHTKGASFYGVLGMAGNAWDWVQDYYAEEYWKFETFNPTGPETGILKVIKGGCYANTPRDLRVAKRNFLSQTSYGYSIGFRCAASP